jgi:hypothetical protein
VLVLLGGAAASQAAPGSLRILFAGNDLSNVDPVIVPVIAAEPGVATVDTFDTSAGTPRPAVLATYDLVVSVGDSSYKDPVSWGDELADYLDAGGAVIQFAFDNWDSPGASRLVGSGPADMRPLSQVPTTICPRPSGPSSRRAARCSRE